MRNLINLWWSDGQVRTPYSLPIFFDAQGEILEHFTDYIMSFAKDPSTLSVAPENTVLARVYDLKGLAGFLAMKKVDWKQFNDDLFREFMECTKRDIIDDQIRRPAPMKDEVAAEMTSNRKGEATYDIYEWAQRQGHIVGRIGPGCPIDTMLSDELHERRGIRRNYRPMLFKVPTHRIAIKHFATQEQVDSLNDYLVKRSNDPYISERDLLFVAVIRETAWRADSVSSLTIGQIPIAAELAKFSAEQTHMIRPRRQKCGHQFAFLVSYGLCQQLRRFIDGPRAELLQRLGICASKADEHIFLNRKGEAISTRVICKKITSAFRAIGVQEKRTGTHSVRRMRSNEFGKDILHRKREVGGLVTPDAVQLEHSKLMGQSSRASLEAYRNAMDELEKETDVMCLARQRDANELRHVELCRREAALLLREKQLAEREKRLGLVQISCEPQDLIDELDDF